MKKPSYKVSAFGSTKNEQTGNESRKRSGMKIYDRRNEYGWENGKETVICFIRTIGNRKRNGL